jgi:hypothetical protein
MIYVTMETVTLGAHVVAAGGQGSDTSNVWTEHLANGCAVSVLLPSADATRNTTAVISGIKGVPFMEVEVEVEVEMKADVI